MQRITITIDDELSEQLDAFTHGVGAASRSEAIRDLVRAGLSTRVTEAKDAHCFGIISYAVDQGVRNLASRVPQGRLQLHDRTIAALSVPVDHTTSIDVTLMRGHVADVASYAEALFLERGVMHGTLAMIPVDEDTHRHSHEDDGAEEHTHLRIRSGF